MTAIAEPLDSSEYARLRRQEPVKKAIVRPATPRLMDFPPVLISMAEKLSAWVEDENMRKVVQLAMCVYWDSLTTPPRVTPPGGDEYRAMKLILQMGLAPKIFPCGVCGWPRGEGYDCYTCGDIFSEEDPYQRGLKTPP